LAALQSVKTTEADTRRNRFATLTMSAVRLG